VSTVYKIYRTGKITGLGEVTTLCTPFECFFIYRFWTCIV